MLAQIGQVELLRKLHLLDGEMREVLYLRLLGGASFAQIGEILGRTENWARVTYYRGKEKLKKELESDGA
ncbi:MAG: sigma factor-like helix-turn-helix DNA-binding protein [Oscillospiraceae bacterium]|nr:sigma factor-like helix-turn-helix DNA-binding protein [Oscillospiraceae bacterium]